MTLFSLLDMVLKASMLNSVSSVEIYRRTTSLVR